MTGETAVLEAESLVKRFGGHAAVDGLSLRLAPGEVLGVIGPNGAGKTTLFNLLAGAIAPDEGAIRIGGADVSGEPAEKRLARGLARTFQIPKLFADMTVFENTVVAARGQVGETMLGALFAPLAVARQERRLDEKARDLLDFLNLTRVADDPARTLSGGQRKLLELARALMAEPAILLLDEPAAGVNPALMDFIMGRIEAINADGVAVLLIEHNMSVVQRLCGRAVVMAGGRALAEGAPAAVMADPAVIEAYLGGAPVVAA